MATIFSKNELNKSALFMRAVILNCPRVLFISVHTSSQWVKGTATSVVLSVSTLWSGVMVNVMVDEDEDEDEQDDKATEKLE